ncbi:hypothetical protein AURDEDRAFT_117126 [Auricularia subglabra TFB-10046 SS5]|uniref:BHLH domain-containing protein n=1 Tax=Auricularia subglabra (strain TFB-10046 / SS5) TaxID=717982 RepID=J0WU50_AURST|nr:hypothetical protein AURDEDRAFT_117126 [Auricularia subglabra TFB-10046 SS5]
MSTSTSSPSETAGTTEADSPHSDFDSLVLPPSPTMNSYDFGNGETVSFLAEAHGHPHQPQPQPSHQHQHQQHQQQHQQQQHKLAAANAGYAAGQTWNQLLWADAGQHSGWPAANSEMDIDPQLAAQDNVFVDPASIFAPGPVHGQQQDMFVAHHAAQHGQVGIATPQELAGLAPLLDAFPFTFDASGFPVMKPQPGGLLDDSRQAFMPSPSPEQSDSSMTASEDEIARFARESVGIVQAVVAGSIHDVQMTAKVPVPRLGRPIPHKHQAAPSSASSSSSGSPPPITPLDAAVPVAAAQPAAPAPGAKGTRPKTSHTTIERRYRTNLNARILALRNAIPATRILDAHPQPPCAVDERGYVDGVKAARKGSKATILAKAVEYISILKARENRLRKENDGLKTLVGSLVGGPQLLDAWERSWREKYGSERDDEALIAGDGGSDEDDSDDEEQARPAKKAKKAAAPPMLPAPVALKPKTPTLDPQTGEKRKRGRPRKNPLVAPAPAPAPSAPVQMPQHAQPGQAQYLLAGFALFSLWNNTPGSSSSSSSAGQGAGGHEGFVVANVRVDDAHAAGKFQWGHAVQAVHVIASLAILASIAIPFVRRRWASRRIATTAPVGAKAGVSLDASDSETDLSASVISAASSAGPATPSLEADADLASVASSEDEGIVMTPKAKATFPYKHPLDGREAEKKPLASAQLAGVLGAHGGVAEVVASGVGYALSSVRVPGLGRPVSSNEDAERIEAWARLAEALVVEGEEAPLSQRFQTFFTLSGFRPRSGAHRAALALLAHSLGMPDADAAWSGIHPETACERIVLGRLSVEQAHDRLLQLPAQEEYEGAVNRLAREWVRTEAKALAREAFQCAARSIVPDPDKVDELRSVGNELGGREARLALAVCNAVPSSAAPASAVAFEADLLDLGDREAEDVVRALLLFRRAFPAACVAAKEDDEENAKDALVSPPPSPAPRDARAMLALQQVLGRPAFDEPALEDARDRIVDMVRAAGRIGRRAALAF